MAVRGHELYTEHWAELHTQKILVSPLPCRHLKFPTLHYSVTIYNPDIHIHTFCV